VAAVNAMMLAMTVAGAMAAGVLLAYGVCQVMFRVFRVHVRSLVAAESAVKARAQAVQS
jgi:hypothetical protein